MKIVFLNGGLANQVFQYIFFRAAQLRHLNKEEWILDDSFFYTNRVHNGYELEKVFGLHPQLLSRYFEKDVWEYMMQQKAEKKKSMPQLLKEVGMDIVMMTENDNYDQWNPFDGQIIHIDPGKFKAEDTDIEGNVYYHGYWIERKWLDSYNSQIKDELIFPEIEDMRNLAYMQEIADSNSTSVHVRRGDYVTDGLAMPAEYYHQMVEAMLAQNPDMTLFVFSDQPKWCTEHEQELGFHLPVKTVYVTGNQNENAFRDLQLMSMCKNMIISNSAFCYLAALLNTDIWMMINPTDKKI